MWKKGRKLVGTFSGNSFTFSAWTRKIVGWREEKNNLLALRPFTHYLWPTLRFIYAPPPSTLVTGRKSGKKLDSPPRRVLTRSRTDDN
jgi:hypothetical protein